MLLTWFFGIEAYVELFGDLGVGTAFEDEGDDPLLFGGEPGFVRVLSETDLGLFFVFGGHESDTPAGVGAFDGFEELRPLLTLVQVAVGTGEDGPCFVLGRPVGGEDEHAWGIGESLYLPAGLYAGALPEPEVGDKEVGAQVLREPDGVGGVFDLADDFEASSGTQDELQAEAEGGVGAQPTL